MPSERGIICNGEEVRGILDGTITQLRRVIKVQPPADSTLAEVCNCPEWGAACGTEFHFRRALDNRAQWHTPCPFGVPGDELYVKETWCSSYQDGAWGTGFRADMSFSLGKRKHINGPHFHGKELGPHVLWNPSSSLPRWASRLDLVLTEVRVQRVQDASEEDAKAEGAFLGKCDCWPKSRTPIEAMMRQTWCHVHGQEFVDSWKSKHAKDGFSWDANPWTGVIGIRRLDKEES